MSNRIPPLLEPSLALPPPSSLTLLTSILGASTNWLILRHLYVYLKSEPDVSVVLVSFMRDAAFWRDGASRLGLDLEGMRRQGRFAFVDGLTGLFTGEGSESDKGDRVEGVLGSAREEDVKREIEKAIGEGGMQRTVLVIDGLDVLLATADEGTVTGGSLSNLLLSLRERVHSTVLSLSADEPLLHNQHTTLEKEHAAFVLGQAHAADRVLSLRMLDTGTARDVSGVVRIKGDGSQGEWLYYLGGDGGVKVFERGT